VYAARGFGLRRLSDASRRPKLYKRTAWPLCGGPDPLAAIQTALAAYQLLPLVHLNAGRFRKTSFANQTMGGVDSVRLFSAHRSGKQTDR
jgi:hypothetical protein